MPVAAEKSKKNIMLTPGLQEVADRLAIGGSGSKITEDDIQIAIAEIDVTECRLYPVPPDAPIRLKRNLPQLRLASRPPDLFLEVL
jgi:hypothetical protein